MKLLPAKAVASSPLENRNFLLKLLFQISKVSEHPTLYFHFLNNATASPMNNI